MPGTQDIPGTEPAATPRPDPGAPTQPDRSSSLRWVLGATRPSLGSATRKRPPVVAPAPVPNVNVPMFQHLLVCLDGSPLSERGLPHAFTLAACFGARVTLLRVLESVPRGAHAAPVDALGWEIGRTEASGYLDHIAAAWKDTGVSIETTLGEGHAPEQIAGFARGHGVDLTVLTTHGRAGLSEWALASTAHKLLDSGIGSVLLVPAASALAETVHYEHVLAPLDGSDRAESVLPLAVKIATAQSGELILVHAVGRTPLTAIGPSSSDDVELAERVTARNRRVAGEYLGRLESQHAGHAVRIRTLLTDQRDVRQILIDVAVREHADLLILSAHGQTGSSECLYGSVTTHLMTHGSLPVLIVQDLQTDVLDRLRSARSDRRAPVRPHGGEGPEPR